MSGAPQDADQPVHPDSPAGHSDPVTTTEPARPKTDATVDKPSKTHEERVAEVVTEATDPAYGSETSSTPLNKGTLDRTEAWERKRRYLTIAVTVANLVALTLTVVFLIYFFNETSYEARRKAAFALFCYTIATLGAAGLVFTYPKPAGSRVDLEPAAAVCLTLLLESKSVSAETLREAQELAITLGDQPSGVIQRSMPQRDRLVHLYAEDVVSRVEAEEAEEAAQTTQTTQTTEDPS